MKNFFNKKFSTKTKLISSAISLMLIVCFAITGTVAWLIDTSGPVEDTFTFGKVDIELYDGTTTTLWKDCTHYANSGEANYGLYTEGNFKMIPGAPFAFDPRVEVLNGSESAYVFVKIEDENALSTYVTSILPAATNWKNIENTNVYYYCANTAAIAKVTNATRLQIFANGQLSVKTELNADSFSTIQNGNLPKLKITAYAIQSEYLNTTDAVAIWGMIEDQLATDAANP